MLLKWGLVLLFAFFVIDAVNSAPSRADNLDWWQNAVVYQIYPRSFKDSDNDGNGDLGGIIEKLDHLVDAGITALWLSPIYKSPQVDAGYDISDFTDIDEMYGTLDQFKQLVSEAHSKNLKVVLDFVPNHSSDQHEWFKKSENSEAGYEDYYVWKDGPRDTPPNTWTSYFHGPAWTYSEVRNQWYLHQFASAQPDLNYRDPKLVQEMKDVLKFWLNIGVDGFRVDIISALFEDINYPSEPEFTYRNDQPETYDMVYQWRQLMDDHQRENGGETRVMMTESYSEPDKLFPYYGNATHNGAHFAFNFWFITKLNQNSNAGDIKSIIDQWMAEMTAQYTANWVLGNHDQHRVASRYGSKRADGLTMLAMLLPGVTVTYNGEEIGMENGAVSWADGKDPQGCNGEQENWESNSRDFERTPYQWDATTNAGFNEGTDTWLPVSESFATVNLEAQKVDDLKSHYRVYQEMIKVKHTDTLKYGNLETSELTTNVLGITRRLEGQSTYVLLVNVADSSETVNLTTIGNLPETLTVKVPSLESNRKFNETIQAGSVILTPYEALLLEAPSGSNIPKLQFHLILLSIMYWFCSK